MKISTSFSKYFFGVVIKQVREQATYPLVYQNPITKESWMIDLQVIDDKDVYQLLKLINPDYPKINELLPVSTTLLTSKELSDHIKWVERFMAENGVCLGYVEEAWQRILESAGIKKEKM
ncbi:MAG: hypothetical protein LHW59_05375 [Candidatus Cloacimonetes bacterium]|nr:hypothetical protein [Candidatus Cloacimonadota bacterium]